MHDMVRLRGLRTLLLIAELGSFNKTAVHQNTTQPAISARVRNLEEHFGRKLVHRRGREVTLTAAGQEVVRYARPIIELMERLEGLFDPAQRVSGTVRIGAIDTIIYSWLGSLFERLHEQYPELNFEVRADTSVNLGDSLKNGEIDIALMMGPIEMEGMTNLELCSFPMAWVANPRKFTFEPLVDVTELIDYPIISYPRGSKPYRMIEAYFAGESNKRLKLNCSNSLSTLIRLVSDGFGIAAIPPTLLQRELNEGLLRIIPVRQTFPALLCHACYFTAARPAAAGIIAQMAIEEAVRFSEATAAPSPMHQS